MNSAQFGLPAMVAVICLFRLFREGLEDVSIRMTSCRLEGGRVKRIGIVVDILVGGGGVRFRRGWRRELWCCGVERSSGVDVSYQLSKSQMLLCSLYTCI